MEDFAARLNALRASFGDFRETDDAPARSRELGTLLLTEVGDAAKQLAGGIFERAFHAQIPAFPRHFILLLRSAGADEAIGYAHHTRAGPVYLAGGLVVSHLRFRSLDKATADLVRGEGGLAEWIGRTTCECLDCDAVFAYMGDKISIRVNTRVGFLPTEYPHLYVLWKKTLPERQREELVRTIAAFGAF